MDGRCIYKHILRHAGEELNIYEFLSRVLGGGSSSAAVGDVIIYLPTPGIIFHPVSGGRVQTSLSEGRGCWEQPQELQALASGTN